MGQITYKINNGYPNFTAHIEPNVAADQIHSSTGIYSFNDIPEGNYSITITDAIGCEAFFDNIVITTTTTTTAYVCDYNGVLNVGVDETTYGYIKDVLGSLTPSPTVHGTEVTGVYYEEGYLYVDILSSEITIDTIIINSIEYIITDGVSEPIDNPFGEELDYNICVNASVCSPEIWICGSGEVDANGGYCNVGMTNGKILYVKGNYTIFWYVQSDIECWVVRYADSTYLYYSEEDVLTPDLVSEWHVGTFGTVYPETAIGQLPLPIIDIQSCTTTTTTTTQYFPYLFPNYYYRATEPSSLNMFVKYSVDDGSNWIVCPINLPMNPDPILYVNYGLNSGCPANIPNGGNVWIYFIDESGISIQFGVGEQSGDFTSHCGELNCYKFENITTPMDENGNFWDYFNINIVSGNFVNC